MPVVMPFDTLDYKQDAIRYCIQSQAAVKFLKGTTAQPQSKSTRALFEQSRASRVGLYCPWYIGNPPCHADFLCSIPSIPDGISYQMVASWVCGRLDCMRMVRACGPEKIKKKKMNETGSEAADKMFSGFGSFYWHIRQAAVWVSHTYTHTHKKYTILSRRANCETLELLAACLWIFARQLSSLLNYLTVCSVTQPDRSQSGKSSVNHVYGETKTGLI